MQRGSKGFTLVELIVVIAILSVLLGMAVLRIASAREDADKKACYTDRALIARTYQLALIKNSSTSLQNFIDDPAIYGTYYSVKPTCPAGGTYTAINGKIVCSHPEHDNEVSAGSGTTVEVTSNSLILTIKALASIDKYNKNGNPLDGQKLNEELKEKLGDAFLPVEDYIIEMAFGDKYKGSGLTWRTDSAGPTTIYFAGDGSSNHSNWAAYLVVVDGVLYKTKLTEGNGSIRTAGVAQLYQKTGTSLQEALAKDFTVVGPIDY
ncbi:MAG: type II secretion system protein [Acholeplasmataceae bacterium]|nr:type II secretion system protein [Acholeplasmataceae bacterium]